MCNIQEHKQNIVPFPFTEPSLLFFLGSNCLTGSTKTHFLMKSIVGIHSRNRNNTTWLDIHSHHSNIKYSLKSPWGSHRNINILTTKVLIKYIYLIYGRDLVSRIKSGHIEPLSRSFPNFISHPNDKNCSKYLTSQDKSPKWSSQSFFVQQKCCQLQVTVTSVLPIFVNCAIKTYMKEKTQTWQNL